VNILLDTCTFLWVITDNPKLSSKGKALFADSENDVYLSVASTWEIAVKHKLGKLPLPDAPDRYIPQKREQHEIDTLPLTEQATLYLPKLPDLHRDPFDRVLICQAIVEGMCLLTPDVLITQYPVHAQW
jgi:PIN domain nuclease of toxin-antitoxin system